MSDRHPATTGLLRWFEFDHLPEHLQAVSRPIGELAHAMVVELPDGPELTTGLRKLLEAKDCLVRAALEGVQSRERLDGHGPGVAYLKGVAAGRRALEGHGACGDTIDDAAASRMRSCRRFDNHIGPHKDGRGTWGP